MFTVLLMIMLVAAASASISAKFPEPLRKFPTPTYAHIACGETGKGNITYTEESTYDYFAIVDATDFTIRATNWAVEASTTACENVIYLMFAPNSDAPRAFGPQEHYLKSGDSFEFAVHNYVAPGGPVQDFDMIFFNGGGGSFPCNYKVTIEQMDIIC